MLLIKVKLLLSLVIDVIKKISLTDDFKIYVSILIVFCCYGIFKNKLMKGYWCLRYL